MLLISNYCPFNAFEGGGLASVLLVIADLQFYHMWKPLIFDKSVDMTIDLDLPFKLVVYNGKFCLLLLKFIPLHLFIKILSKGYAVNLLFLLIR
jgi:hypothetical protein